MELLFIGSTTINHLSLVKRSRLRHDPESHLLPDTRLFELQWTLNHLLALRGSAEPEDLKDGWMETLMTDLTTVYFTQTSVAILCLPGQSSTPSSITNMASDEPKANPVVATTGTLQNNQIEE
jgi:hypothetical protein